MSRKQLIVDRNDLIAWSQGVLLQFQNGKGIAPNELECEAAEQALERGEKVLLKTGNKLTGTYMVLKDGVYQEVEINTKRKNFTKGLDKLP